MPDWSYGGAYERFPTDKGIIRLGELGTVACHDIMQPLPAFMKQADVIFTDPPWNNSNIHSFYTKANLDPYSIQYNTFFLRLFDCVEEINPNVCYIEIGKEYLPDVIDEMKRIYPHVTFIISSYYHKKENICFVVRGSRKLKKLRLDYMDEEDIIEWVCANESYECIGDLCMGRGLVGLNAFKNGRRFVGTELNHKRLSVLAENISKNGGNVEIIKSE